MIFAIKHMLMTIMILIHIGAIVILGEMLLEDDKKKVRVRYAGLIQDEP